LSNIVDVAAKAKVSIATVSRVMNNSPHRVKKATRERVLAAVNELNYCPSALAKGLLANKTRTVGVLIPDIANPYYAEIVRGIQAVAGDSGYAITLYNTNRCDEGMLRYIYLLREKLADGIIFSGGIIDRRKTLAALQDLKEKVVVIGRHNVNVPAVLVDNTGGLTKAVEHLHKLGHRDIAYIGGPEGSNTARDRLTGFRVALAELGIPFEKKWVQKGTWQPESGYQQALALLAQSPRPSAIIAANDLMAFGALRAAYELGLPVPGKVAIVGFDNVPMAAFSTPPLTSLEVPMYRLGATAMEMMIDLLAGKDVLRQIKFATTLRIRASSARP
jgi:LacI family transcriptional regulator